MSDMVNEDPSGKVSICLQADGLSDILFSNQSNIQIPSSQIEYLQNFQPAISNIAHSVKITYIVALITGIISALFPSQIAKAKSIRVLSCCASIMTIMYIFIANSIIRNELHYKLEKYEGVLIYFGSIFFLSVMLLYIIIGTMLSQALRDWFPSKVNETSWLK